MRQRLCRLWPPKPRSTFSASVASGARRLAAFAALWALRAAGHTRIAASADGSLTPEVLTSEGSVAASAATSLSEGALRSAEVTPAAGVSDGEDALGEETDAAEDALEAQRGRLRAASAGSGLLRSEDASGGGGGGSSLMQLGAAGEAVVDTAASDASGDANSGTSVRRRRRRFAMSASYTSDFNGTTNDDILDMTEGRLAGPMSIEFVARWDEFRPWACVMDFCRGNADYNIKVCSTDKEGELAFFIFKANVEKGFRVTNAYKLSTPAMYLLTVNVFGLMKVWKDGLILQEYENGWPPEKVFRSNFFVGRSSLETEPSFSGRIQDLYLWNMEAEWGKRDTLR
eukprot:TRINITY_DN54632_c0_g1_i1.p1 TRINITY_DN54632_c0_g1~~TRINITY_DN54632_c0_g1_i1.p1  ORF type:complete len:343 (+),score=92.58 TRINITY_DN54632_c0_g1_i1:105-1133(+)